MKNFFIILIIAAFSMQAQAQIQGYNVGDVVTDFTVTDIEGHTHNLYTYTAAGKYVWIDFFYSTCGPCQSVTPVFNEFYDKYGCNQGDVICISMNSGYDNTAAVIAYENTYGGSFEHAPAISNQGGATAIDADFNPTAYPTICLIGPNNQLVNGDIWPISGVSSFEASFPTGFSPSPMACTVGLTDNTAPATITKVFPNPATDQTVVSFNTIEGNTYSISVINVLGETVYSKTNIAATDNQLEIDLGELKNGLYIIRLYENNNFISASKLQLLK